MKILKFLGNSFAIALLTSTCFLCIASAQAQSVQNRFTISDEDASGPGSPRVIVLRDNVAGLEAAIAPSEGGELSSYRIKFKGQWIELLYHARDYSPGPEFKGKAPLLWPAIGQQYLPGTTPKSSCNDEGLYQLDGKTYPMPCHGFARSLPWKEIQRSTGNNSASVTLELRDSDRTRSMYPFAFQLDATYDLADGHLTISYTVISDHSNIRPMIFSIGNHIAFNLPFIEGTDPATMTLETPSTTQLLRDSHGLLNGQLEPRSFDTPTRLGDFDATVAIPLAGYKSQPFTLLKDPQGLSVRVSQQASSNRPEPLVRFALYGGPKTGYLSTEPWFGIQNSLNSHQGLVTLAPGESWKWRVEVEADGPPPDLSPTSIAEGVERIASGFGFVEGPVWTKENFLVFSDIFNSRIMKLDRHDRTEIYRNYSHAANGNSMDAQGRLYSCERDGRRVVRMEKDGSLTVIASAWQGKRLNSPNDVVVRRDGQVYFTDPASKAVLEPQELGFNGLYHVTPSGKISLIAKMPRPNGVALTPDGKILYVADTDRKKIFAYDLDGEGNASHERTVISGIDGWPDGLRVAANGNLYIAARGISVYAPNGKWLRTIEFPETPANCSFGDADLHTLYVTARTSLYRVRIPDVGSLQY